MTFTKRMTKELIGRVTAVGTRPICNLDSDTAPSACGVTCPLCWRCLAIGLGIGSALLLNVEFASSLDAFAVGLAMTIPCWQDGIRRYFFRAETTNAARVATGFPAGMGLFIVAVELTAS